MEHNNDSLKDAREEGVCSNPAVAEHPLPTFPFCPHCLCHSRPSPAPQLLLDAVLKLEGFLWVNGVVPLDVPRSSKRALFTSLFMELNLRVSLLSPKITRIV